jgi:hypothetical protein
MKEAVSGALIIKIMMIFFVLYIAFLAIAINYSQAFRVKNEIINIIEQYEGLNGKSESEIKIFLNEIKYTNEYSIVPVQTDRGPYYIITTHIKFKFPIFGDVLNFPIKGETKIIYQKS